MSRIDRGGLMLRRLMLGLALAAPALGAQRMRVTMPHDTAQAARAMYLFPGDTATLLIDTWTAAGVQVLASGSGYEGIVNVPCLRALSRDTVGKTLRYRFTERPQCAPVATPGALYMQARVGSKYLSDTVLVSRPPEPALGSDLAVCTAANPTALFYASRDTAIAMAILGADSLRIPWTFADMDSVARFSWQGARLLLQFSAVACAAGWRAWDVSDAARWVTSDTTVASVLKSAVLSSAGPEVVRFPGVVLLWKRTGNFSLRADWP
jgi:hypothetical protein